MRRKYCLRIMKRMDNPRFSVSDDEVALRAYWVWEAAGRPEGRALEHWLEAAAAD